MIKKRNLTLYKEIFYLMAELDGQPLTKIKAKEIANDNDICVSYVYLLRRVYNQNREMIAKDDFSFLENGLSEFRKTKKEGKRNGN